MPDRDCEEQKMFERILVPLENSKIAELVLPYVEELAGHLKSEVTLLYVCERGEEQTRRVHEAYMRIIADGIKRNIREHYPKRRGARVRVRSVVMVGKPFDEICNYAVKNDVGLVVLATRCGSGIMHLSIGHIPNRLFEKTGIPLLLITTAAKHYPEPSPGQLLDRILLPLDGSEVGEIAIPYVAELASRQWAQVTLLQVVEPGQHVHTIGGPDYVKFTEQQIELMKVRAKEYLESVGKRLADTRAFVRYEVRVGDTTKEIINLATEMGARLVVVSAHHFLGIRQLISGNIAQKILQTTNIPVLLLRTQD